MSAVAKLTPKRVVIFSAPEPKVIGHLEKLLERARKGEIRAIAYATVSTDGLSCDGGGTHCGYAASPNTSHAVTHAIERLRKSWADDEL